MKLDGFRFRHVGPFGAEGIAVDGIRDGLNVIAEHNERGKSSLLAALELFLFRPHTSWDRQAKALEREDGTPVGEIDFTHDGRPLRLTKSFRKGKDAVLSDRGTGAVVAKKAEAEERLAELLGSRGKMHGPSGLLWVRQGDSMESVSDQNELVASRLESELSTLVGGERARDYLTRTESALSEFRTATGRDKGGGPIAVTKLELAEVDAALDAAQSAAEATREMGRELTSVRAQIDSSEAALDPAQTAARITAAREQLRTAQSAQDVLETARANALRLAGDAARASDKLAAHQSRTQRYDETSATLSALSAQLSTLTAQRTEADAALRAASDAQTALFDARDQLARIDKQRADAERLSDRNAALQRVLGALDATADIAARKATLTEERDALPDVGRGALDTLSRLERSIEQLDAKLDSVDTALSLELGPEVVATLDGAPLTSGRVRLSADSTLRIEGVGTIRLDAPEADALRAERESLAAELARTFAALRVDSYAEAAQVQAARTDLNADIKELAKDIDRIAPDGLDVLADRAQALEDDIATLARQLDDGPDPESVMDADALAAQLDTARTDVATAQARLSEIVTDIATVTERISAAKRTLAELPESARPAMRREAFGALSSEAATATRRADDAQAALDAAQAQPTLDPAMIEATIARLSTAASNQTETLTRLRLREAQLVAARHEAFERRDPDAEAGRLLDKQAALEEALAAHERRADALTLLRDTLQGAQSSLRDQYTAPVTRELAPLLSQVIDGAQVSLTEQLGAHTLARAGRNEDIGQLSGGTREQIAILTRLAFARLLARGGHPCPVILDDALVYADDGRRERMFNVMNYVASGEDALQLIYLSCHQSAAAQLGGHRLEMGPWSAQN